MDVRTRHVGTGELYFSKPREPFTERLAWAICWDFSIGKATTPRQLFMAQTEGCKENFRERADELAPCLRRVGFARQSKRKAKGKR